MDGSYNPDVQKFVRLINTDDEQKPLYQAAEIQQLLAVRGEYDIRETLGKLTTKAGKYLTKVNLCELAQRFIDFGIIIYTALYKEHACRNNPLKKDLNPQVAVPLEELVSGNTQFRCVKGYIPPCMIDKNPIMPHTQTNLHTTHTSKTSFLSSSHMPSYKMHHERNRAHHAQEDSHSR